jgi:hypothetical protein
VEQWKVKTAQMGLHLFFIKIRATQGIESCKDGVAGMNRVVSKAWLLSNNCC